MLCCRVLVFVCLRLGILFALFMRRVVLLCFGLFVCLGFIYNSVGCLVVMSYMLCW